jgi:prepilin peptidase CpaA
MPSSPLAVPLLILGFAALVAAAVHDLQDKIIPNGLVVFVIGIGLALRSTAGLASVGWGLAGAGLVFVVLAYCARHKIVGGGDAKLIAAATLLVSPDRIVPLLLAIALLGGLFGCFYLVEPFVFPHRKFHRAKLNKQIPYAPAILGGVSVCTLFEVFQCYSVTSCSL